MPLEWASDELKGAEAVAFRVVPSYKTCGWGGDPKACQEDAVRCDMDVYFDHKLNPLPWDERMRNSEADTSTTSVDFVRSSVNRPYRPRTTLLGGVPLPREPFTDPKSGKELGWQSVGATGQGWTGIGSYDREIFQGISLVTFGVGCGAPSAAWLAESLVWEKDARAGKGVHAFISMPPSWQSRIKQALADSDQRSKAFFKEQGLKAIKALQAQPVPSKPAAPIQ
jgi:hypothetical protein